MYLRLATALLLASAVSASAQRASGTPASQMAARAAANAGEAQDAAANGVNSLYASPDDTTAEQPSDAQRIIRGQVNGTPNDPILHYPYGRYSPTLGNVSPDSLANPFTNPALRGTAQPAPSPFRANAPAFGISRAPAFSRGR